MVALAAEGEPGRTAPQGPSPDEGNVGLRDPGRAPKAFLFPASELGCRAASRGRGVMQPIMGAVPALAVAAIFCTWNAYRRLLVVRGRCLRERVAFLLWVAASRID